MGFRLRCPVCRKAFAYNPATEKLPDECPLCETYIGSGRDDNVVCAPFIRSAATRANDQVYSEIEKSSERRAEIAAEMSGVPVSEMSSLKVTNLNDARRAGDVAAVPVNNSVTQFMEQSNVGGYTQSGAGFMPSVMSGPLPNAGAKFRTMLHEHHAQATGGAGVSDRPANEVLQTGYRRRG